LTRTAAAGATLNAGATLEPGAALKPGAEASRAAGPAVPGPTALAFHLPLAVPVMVVSSDDACPEREPGEEDDGDDEHRARDDADPRRDDVEPAAAAPRFDVSILDDDRCGGGRCLDGTRGRFW